MQLQCTHSKMFCIKMSCTMFLSLQNSSLDFKFAIMSKFRQKQLMRTSVVKKKKQKLMSNVLTKFSYYAHQCNVFTQLAMKNGPQKSGVLQHFSEFMGLAVLFFGSLNVHLAVSIFC